MKRLALVLAIVGTSAAAEGRFRPIAVYVDAGATPLAAYQVEIVLGDGAEIAGVEGGEAAAFRAAPYYDPAALRRGRIVVAAFRVGGDLPTGRTRVATVHVHEREGTTPRHAVKLVVAAGAGGGAIPASATLVPQEGDPP